MSTIEGTNTYGHDLQLLQDALAGGEDRIELEGVFDLGLGDDRSTLVIARPVTISGGKAGATIRGGGMSLGPQNHAGAFVVANAAAGPVVIDGLRFEQSRLASIVVSQCHGIEVTSCEFIDGQRGSSAGFVNEAGDLVTIVSAVVALGESCEGRFLARDNRCSFGGAGAGAMPDDEQFIATFGTNFEFIHITSNKMATRDDGIEVLRNRYTAEASLSCEILIEDNEITIEQQVGVPTDQVWPVHAGIVCCLNGPQGTGATRIADNTIRAHGPNVSAFVLSGEHIVVTDNYVELQTGGGQYPTAAFLFGFDVLPNAQLGHLGASLKQSTISNNTVTGSAPHGIWAWENDQTLETNDSRANEVKDNDFGAFTAAAGDAVYPHWLLETNTFVENAGL